MAEVQQAVWSVNPNLPLARVRTLQQIYDESMAQTSFVLVILGIAASVTLLLGLVGIYGVIAYIVSQRRREVGIRMALGAHSGEVQRMFVSRGLMLTGVGLGRRARGGGGPDAVDVVAAVRRESVRSDYLCDRRRRHWVRSGWWPPGCPRATRRESIRCRRCDRNSTDAPALAGGYGRSYFPKIRKY